MATCKSGESRKTRFLYLDSIPTPYRVTIFNRVQKAFCGEFKVIYASEKDKCRNWTISEHQYPYQVLRGFSWNPPFEHNPSPLKWNPSILSALRKWNPDVLACSGYAHPTMLLAMLWARRNRIPYGIACESSFLSARTRSTFRFKQMMVGTLIRDAGFGLATGSKAKEYLMAFGLKTENIYYFPNAPEIEYVSSKTREFENNTASVRDLKKRYPLSDNFVLFVGRMLPMKQPSDLIDAWLRVPAKIRESYDLVFCGSGPLSMDLLRHSAAQSMTRVKFLGDVSYEDVIRIMTLSRVLVLPSIYEPWGAVVNEALSTGTPAICSDAVGAAYDMIREGETGWTYPVGDIRRLAAAITKAVGLSTAEYQRMQEKCKDLATDWDGTTAASNLIRAVTTTRAFNNE